MRENEPHSENTESPMTLLPGTRLGPYEIVSPLGAGGMGEVYRARDPKLERDVAVKVLPESLPRNAQTLARFEREARAVAALSHPNILAIFDFGRHEETVYAVMELLEGETLRGALSAGALPQRKAVEYAIQIARGLAAAHEKGIVHRDLKPENVFVTKGGHVKILDFGLAKQTRVKGPDDTSAPTESWHTEPGTVMGTLSYMSPEQVRGEAIDHRSDIFSFGCVLYEMLSGTRAFTRATAAETMTAILKEEPPDLAATNRNVRPGLERIVLHCLEKKPEERFYSARDVAFGLAELTETSAPAATLAVRDPRRLLAGVTVVLALVAAFAAGWALRARQPAAALPAIRQLTFRRGSIWNGKFGADGKSVIYTAAWEGGPQEIFLGRSDGPDARPLGLPDAEVLAVSQAGEMAVSLRPRFSGAFVHSGTLARLPVAGGVAPREVLEDVEFADFSPDGKELAIVRVVNGRRRLEYPIGKLLYESRGWIGDPRIAPDGGLIAFADYPSSGENRGRIATVDLSGRKVELTDFSGVQGLSWSPDGKEIWFTAAGEGLRAVSLRGRVRDLYQGTGKLVLADVARDGRVLLKNDVHRVEILASGGGPASERDLTWYGWSLLNDLSADGKTVAFTECNAWDGVNYAVCIRATDGSPAIRLGEGSPDSISPDGKRVLATIRATGGFRLVVYPTGAGETRAYDFPGIRPWFAKWLPDGRRFLMLAAAAGKEGRVFLVDAEKGDPRPLTPEGIVRFFPLDAKRFLARSADRATRIFSIDGGEPETLGGIGPTDDVVGPASRDGWIYLRHGRTLPANVVLHELATGREEKWKELMPGDATGVNVIYSVQIAPDGRSYAYSYGRMLSDLFTFEGLK
ncbi:MAG: Serine/threonine-protein kinase PknD [Thermoanaerobaculia bacterium]|nr:Serine/threonine-protein kinase PknD [Thermoanaerobaculia bacterium]